MTSPGESKTPFKVGFHVRNRFQIGHFRRLFAEFDDAVWICGSRPLRRYLRELGYRRILRPNETRSGMLDAILTQGGVEPYMRRAGSCLAMVQYGYAKAPYNFGLWRAAADVVFAYGPYAQSRFGFLTHSVSVGNPRWDDFLDPAFRLQAKDRYTKLIRNGLPMVVYAPTWGELSSVNDWMEAVLGLAGTANVFVKAHHNSAGRALHPGSGDGRARVHFVPDDDLFELLVCADLLISDFSGAIFDALLCEKPVVLLDGINSDKKSGKKLDDLSPEVTSRALLGRQVSEPLELQVAVAEVLANSKQYVRWAADLREQLFDVRTGVCERISMACRTPESESISDSAGQMRLYVHQGVSELVEKLNNAKRLFLISLLVNALLFMCAMASVVWLLG